jgi:hypothetical protein
MAVQRAAVIEAQECAGSGPQGGGLPAIELTCRVSLCACEDCAPGRLHTGCRVRRAVLPSQRCIRCGQNASSSIASVGTIAAGMRPWWSTPFRVAGEIMSCGKTWRHWSKALLDVIPPLARSVRRLNNWADKFARRLSVVMQPS